MESRASVATLAIFAALPAAKMLVGEPPQTRLRDKMSRNFFVCVTGYRSCL
ncbi:hypothetical protein OBV_32660 [Oscillibacter valericigenes Sjm18-20]|nr:hypothetical protein OBV_32660 [Oscillibacter valericigenes Sjm18-20]